MRVFGCDVAKNFLVLCDGSSYFIYVDSPGAFKATKRLPKNALIFTDIRDIVNSGDVVVLEQTGSYGTRYAKLLESIGAKVFIADGKAFKRFRGHRSTAKNDFVDAKFLRRMFLHKPEEDEEDWRRFIYPFHYGRYRLRVLVRHKIRLEKDLTRFINRLRQLLSNVFPDKNYYDMPRNRLLKTLDEIERELLSNPDALSIPALTEIEKIRATLRAIELTEKEIKSIVLNHKDYELLKTFPHFGIMAIASLVAYYWDIDLFKSKDGFISYVLMGTKTEQSGTSVNSSKTDKTRTEVKAYLYMVYLQSFTKNSPLYPIAQWLKRSYSGRHQNKKRFIKFAHKILELVYYALKRRLTFYEVLELTISNMERQFSTLEKISYDDERISNYRFPELFWVKYSRLKALIPVYKDIASRYRKRAEIITGKGAKSNLEGDVESNKRRPCEETPGTAKEGGSRDTGKTAEQNRKRAIKGDSSCHLQGGGGRNKGLRDLQEGGEEL